MIGFVKRHLIGLAMLGMSFVIAIGGFFVYTTTVKAYDDQKWSFYELSASAAGYMSKKLAPDGYDGNDTTTGYLAVADNMQAGDAGIFLGYTDAGKLGDESGGFFLVSMLTKSAISYSYDTFKDLATSSDGSTTTPALYQYCRYGYLLTSLGLDTSAADGNSLIRIIAGGPIIFLYTTSMAVPLLMNMILKALQFINPFNLLRVGTVWANNGNNGLGTLGSTADGQDLSSWSYLATQYGKVINFFYNLSWAIVIPLFFALLIASLLLFRSGNAKHKIRMYIVRVASIVLLVPVLGGLYTASLDWLINMTDMSNSAAALVVAQSFCDFETWAKNTNLAIPLACESSLKSIGSDDIQGGNPSKHSMWEVRNTCAAINVMSGSLSVNVDIGSSSSYAGKIGNWNSAVIDGLNSATGYDADEVNAEVFDILARYMTSAYYYSSDFESLVKSEWSSQSGKSGRYIGDAVAELDTVGDWENTDTGAVKWISKDGKWDGDKSNYPDPVPESLNFLTNGNITASGNTSLIFKQPGGAGNTSSRSQVKRGLSDLAMYNYLNTSFDPQSITVYSANDSTSMYTRDAHMSVNLVGSGFTHFMYWVNAFCTLLAYTIVGWFYAMAMLFGNIKRGVILLTKIPFVFMGAVRAIAQCISYVFLMIIESIATIFLYMMIMEIMKVLPNAIMNLLAGFA